MTPGIKLMNKRGTLPKRPKVHKRSKPILEPRNSVSEMGNALESAGTRADQMEERINELKDGNLGITQKEVERELSVWKMKELYENDPATSERAT